MRHEEIAYSMGYRVTEDGRVLGLRTTERKLQLNRAGYYQFSYSKRTPRIRVHRLQAFQKFGAKIYESGMMVRHLDGNKHNNSLSNIEIGTNSQNQLDRKAEERQAAGRYAASFLRGLSNDQVIEIRIASANGARVVDLAKTYSIVKSTVSSIVTGKLYADIGGPIREPKKCGRPTRKLGRGTA